MRPKATPDLIASKVTADAVLSACGTYRYRLDRVWNPNLPTVGFLMLNPSTADAMLDDPTVRRCVGFARLWGYGGIAVVNLFALRATDPRKLYVHPDPVGPENNEFIVRTAAQCACVIAAWGVHGGCQGRDRVVSALFPSPDSLRCLGTTKDGHPRHPLYLRADATIVPYPRKA